MIFLNEFCEIGIFNYIKVEKSNLLKKCNQFQNFYYSRKNKWSTGGKI